MPLLALLKRVTWSAILETGDLELRMTACYDMAVGETEGAALWTPSIQSIQTSETSFCALRIHWYVCACNLFLRGGSSLVPAELNRKLNPREDYLNHRECGLDCRLSAWALRL
jgi:hypothetical protein